MKKVYKALYKTEWIYSDGYVIVYPDNTLEGVFALDYMYIYNDNNKHTAFLKTLSFYVFNGMLMYDLKNYEFYSLYKQIFYPFNSYLFSGVKTYEDGTCSITVLSLELKEEIFDVEQIQHIITFISEIRG